VTGAAETVGTETVNATLTVNTAAVAVTREQAVLTWSSVIVEVMDLPQFPNALRLNAAAAPREGMSGQALISCAPFRVEAW
jgi:hypothetical protein